MTKDETPPAFLLYVDDFTSDGVVEAMTTEEVGAYFLLLCKAWREEAPGTIPNNDRVLARWARLTPDRWAECKPAVLAAFKLARDGRYHQSRMRREYEKLKRQRRDRKESAILAAKARWHSNGKDLENKANPCESHTERNTNVMRKNAFSTSSSSSSSFSSSRASDVRRQDVDALGNVSQVDIGLAIARFRRTVRIVRPSSKEPQRSKDLDLLAKASILSVTKFSENWLADAAEAVRVQNSNKPPCAYFHGVLRSKSELLGADLNRELAMVVVPDGFIQQSLDEAVA